MKKIVVPQKERIPNRVDEILAEAKNIQDNCKHDFRLVETPKIVESLVRGVYVGDVHGPVKISGGGEVVLKLSLVYLKCSQKRETTILVTCPYCLGSMREGEIQNPRKIGGEWVWPRTIYFGEEYLYYSIRLYWCPDCGFTVACDEWNQ